MQFTEGKLDQTTNPTAVNVNPVPHRITVCEFCDCEWKIHKLLLIHVDAQNLKPVLQYVGINVPPPLPQQFIMLKASCGHDFRKG